MEEESKKNITETIQGTVEDITCYKVDSGFVVFGLDFQGDYLTVVGTLGKVEPGEEVILTGTFTTHPTYGNQFRAEVCERRLPASVSAMKKYLSGGSFKGVGKSLAEKIVDAFGEYTLEVIENDPKALSKVKGVSERMANEISEEFKRAFGARQVMTSLQAMGLDAQTAVRAWKKWGCDAFSFIEENPYLLCDPDIGMEFADADEIFIKKGNRNDERRTRAGIKFVLTHNMDNGHTCLPEDSLIGASLALLMEKGIDATDEDTERVGKIIDALVSEEELCDYDRSGRRFIYLPELFFAEKNSARRLSMMLNEIGTASDEVINRQIFLLEDETGITYDELQKKAISMALKYHAFVLTGGPGTGKTTAMNALISLLELSGENVMLAAPTGRAAKRLSEVTGHEAKTIHRLLEVDFAKSDMRPVFRKNEKNPLKCTTLIVDEMSMVDSFLFDSLLRALNFSTRLVMVGDSDQLPSVGPGNVLHDLLKADMLPSVTLDTIFRQAAESMIITNAHDIVNGDYPYLESKSNDFFFLPRQSEEEVCKTVCDLCKRRLPEAYGYSPFSDIQVLCPGKKGLSGTWNLNNELQGCINPPSESKRETRIFGTLFRDGDKVMQTKNNYDIEWKKDDGELGKGIYNGDIGIIERVDKDMRILVIKFDDKTVHYPFDGIGELEHAYAITVHKSQGSEFDAVILPLLRPNSRLYYRNLLYTAVTRAKSLLIIVGDSRAVMAMVDNNRKNGRFTNLKYMLCENCMGANNVC